MNKTHLPHIQIERNHVLLNHFHTKRMKQSTTCWRISKYICSYNKSLFFSKIKLHIHSQHEGSLQGLKLPHKLRKQINFYRYWKRTVDKTMFYHKQGKERNISWWYKLININGNTFKASNITTRARGQMYLSSTLNSLCKLRAIMHLVWFTVCYWDIIAPTPFEIIDMHHKLRFFILRNMFL